MNEHMIDDEHFIGYCNLHSQTERHLFSSNDAERLAKLAGTTINWGNGPIPQFVALNEELVDSLIKDYRKIKELELASNGSYKI